MQQKAVTKRPMRNRISMRQQIELEDSVELDEPSITEEEQNSRIQQKMKHIFKEQDLKNKEDPLDIVDRNELTD